MTDDKKYNNLFDEDDKKKPNATKKHKGIVANINKKDKKITVDVNGNGESTPYIETEHVNLKIGDPIEF